jgi:spermidine synthase
MDDKRMSIPFLTKWFEEKSRAIWEEHLPAAVTQPFESYLEIGVGEGHSMRWVLENLKPKEAYGIDPYVPKRRKEKPQYEQQEANMRQNLAPWLDSKALMIIPERSQTYLVGDTMLSGTIDTFDLIYVDGDHRCFECMTDMVLCWPMLKMGGIMIIDDYDRRWQRGWPWTREAVNAFLSVVEKRYEVVWGNPLDMECTHIAIRKFRDQ